MITYSDTQRLIKMYKDYCTKHNLAMNAISLVSFMRVRGWLNQQQINRDIEFARKKEQENEK